MNLLEYLETSTSKYPKKIAFTDEFISMSFEELALNAKSLGYKIHLTTNDINKPVAIFVDRSVFSVVGMQAILYSGNFYVPIDKTLPIQRIYDILSIAKAIVYKIEDAQILNELKKFDNLDIPMIQMECDNYINNIDEVMSITDVDDTLKKIREKVLSVDPAYMIFTSGSTGKPKGIVVSHASVIDFTDWLTSFCVYTSNDIFANQAPFYFDLSVKDLYQTLSLGATCHILNKKLFTFPALLIEEMNKNNITAINWATSAFHLVASSNILDKAIPTSLKKVTVGGEALKSKFVNKWKSKLPNLNIINLYGPTEVTVDCTGYHIDRSFDDDEVIPIGNACKNKEIILLDNNKLVSDGDIGEICVRGLGLANGYYGDFIRTNESFIQNPLNPFYRDILYKTGDLAYRNNINELIFVSRKDYQVKHMGHRVELSEIENVVSNINGVDDAICLFDSDVDKIITFFKTVDNLDITNYLAREVRSLLPKYMLPNKYIKIDEFPLNPNGKIDKVKLKEIYFYEGNK